MVTRQVFQAIVHTTVCVLLSFSAALMAQPPSPQAGAALEARLKAQSPEALYEQAMRSGNPARGAILFHGPLLGCGKCHPVTSTSPDLLGPNLAQPRPDETPQQLVESILDPSARIDDKYRAVQVLTEDGKVLSGLPVKQLEDSNVIVLRTLDTLQDIQIDKSEVVQTRPAEKSAMPDGLVRSLANEQEFYDLLRYVIEIRDGGDQRARELQPTAAQLAIRLPEYESDIDHAGMIRDFDKAAFKRGEKIYNSLCINCHGTLTTRGSLDTALRFGEGKFKFGSDPYSMYQTLTRGAGLMLPQPWMVPQQKYDVIHYIREAYLREHNRSQYFEITEEYLASLPRGTQRGPEPQPLEPWSRADYGPRLVNTYEIGTGGKNIAQKGIAVQLDGQPGGVAHGRAWAIFEHDTMRLAGVWTGQGFIDWQGIHFNGRHGVHPHVVGDVLVANPTAPGWADPETGELADTKRVVGRDGKRYGPLPNSWADYRGFYQLGRHTVISYRVGESPILETYRWTDTKDAPAPLHNGFFARLVRIGPRPTSLRMVAATLDENEGRWHITGARADSETASGTTRTDPTVFDGRRYYEAPDSDQVDLASADFTVVARVKTEGDGTIFSRAPREGQWAPGGQTLFVRGGRLCYDIGWVGVVQSNRPVADGNWHDVALTWDADSEQATLWIDGKQVGVKKLRPKEPLDDACFRIGMTSPNFPATSLLQRGQVAWVRVYQTVLPPGALTSANVPADHLAAEWDLREADAEGVVDPVSGARARLRLTDGSAAGALVVGFQGGSGLRWTASGRQLILEIPSGNTPLDVVVWYARVGAPTQQETLNELISRSWFDASLFEIQNPQRMSPLFPETVVTEAVIGNDQGGFVVDELSIPKANPWLARVRTSGLDFFSDGDRAALCTWDGDVWVVSGLSQLDAGANRPKLTWRRVAFGLFQPLGLRVIDDHIYLTCRDQLVRLEDRNGDGEADFYRCINNDHQVTEHFHEFAMGLQTDAEGNIYYAKSARHALPAVVPQHGTLLKVSRDGSKTTILATGFRAANGVCLNPDGTFIVTDQEGHWNPKNRINWVKPGGFYGNMYGYHNVTDESDSAMEQPLCWITNAFDRSPAELLWVDSPKWGPLDGSLLNLSYGYGRIYIVPHEEINGQMQGGMCALPIADLPTGIIRGRFSPHDRQLYVCGLSAWATNQIQEEGGFYRIRYTGAPVGLPLQLAARTFGMQITFSDPLAADTPLDPERFHVEAWDLKRTKNYGSKHYNQRRWPVSKVELSDDRRTLTLHIPDIAPTWGMEIRMPIKLSDGRVVERVIHNTIHNLRP